MKFVLKQILKILAQLTLKRYRPFIAGVTGSVGKTSTKFAIYSVLKSSFKTRMAGGNLNNEIGLPLTIIGNYKETGGLFFWLGVFLRAFFQIAWTASYPKILVLEYGADKPGDIGYLVKIARPDMAVITAIGDTPAHIEFYESREEVVKEKSKLIKALRPDGIAILNSDDAEVLEMQTSTKAKVFSYGFTQGSYVRIDGFENRSEFGRPVGASFKLDAVGSFVPVKLQGVFGEGQAYAAAAAACVGLAKGVNLVKIAEALGFYEGAPGRSRLIPGLKDSYIIDDTYNASPISTSVALKVLAELKAPKKIAVLGDMLELGKYSNYAHEEIGKQVSQITDILVTVGPSAKFIAEAARQNNFPKKDIYEFNDSEEAKKKVRDLIEEQTIVLVKGSQAMRMEKIVLEIMMSPEDALKLLVRQYGKWLK